MLEAEQNLEAHAYVDASYGVHADAKSHTGGIISIGRGATYVKSSKQKLVSKSSTEAELIGLSDMTSNIIWHRDFLLHQGYHIRVFAIVFGGRFEGPQRDKVPRGPTKWF